MKDRFSLIQWNEVLAEAPTDENILVIYRDDSGDYEYYDTMVAWKINSDIWVSDGVALYIPNIICWTKFPKYKDMKVFG